MSGEVKGWCPSAHRPMMSGDGLLVRVKPRMARLTVQQAIKLCDLAEGFGNGMIDVTSRANLQIRGVSEAHFSALLTNLIAEGLVESDAQREASRTLTVTPFWQQGDLSARLAITLEHVHLPELPDKMGIVLDTGPAPLLQNTSGDFRFEAGEEGALILRAEGADQGRVIAEQDAPEALAEMVAWFIETGGAESKRMARHLKRVTLPKEWQTTLPARSAERPVPGGAIGGRLFGVPFGQADAGALRDLIQKSNATNMRVTPWRMLFLEDAKSADVPGFLNQPDPLLDVAACPGAPACAQSSVVTRDIARRLAPRAVGTLHVSGCAKGCARRSPADLTLVGRDGRFDLVKAGLPGDTPHQSGLSAAEVMQMVAR
ncbi:MAG: cobalamin biosynthesis protein CobG [Paracoccaceae bacterium]